MIGIPFSGSKRYSYKYVKKIAEENDYNTVYEPFGGSCILSTNLYNDKLVGKAVVNDYDHFFDLYPEYLDLKDKVVEEGYRRGLVRTTHNSTRGDYRIYPDGRKENIDSEILQGRDRQIIQDIISEYVPEKFWTYFALGSNFCFSAKSSQKKVYLKEFTKFGRYLKTDKQREYIDVLNRLDMEHLDWHDFLDKYESSMDEKSLLILDPPYIGTYQNQYQYQFTEDETIELIERAKKIGCDFIFFNHDQEQVEGWLKGTDYTIRQTGNATASANRHRYDVMAFIKGKNDKHD